MLSRPALSGVPLLVLAGVLWGTGGLLGTLLAAVTGLSPLAVAGYRLLTGGGLLVAGLLVARRPLPRGWVRWRRIAVTGALAAQFQACYFAAVASTSVGLATLVTIGAAPVIVLAVERVRGRPASRSATAGGVLGMLGLALLVGAPSAAGSPAVGAGFALLAAAGFAALTLLGARGGAGTRRDGLDTVTTTGVGFTLGGVLLLAVAAPVSGTGLTPTPAALGLLVAFAVLPTALAYTLYFRGLRTAPASVGAVVALLEPLTGAALAAVVLGERLGAAGLAGAALLTAAVLLAGGSR